MLRRKRAGLASLALWGLPVTVEIAQRVFFSNNSVAWA